MTGLDHLKQRIKERQEQLQKEKQDSLEGDKRKEKSQIQGKLKVERDAQTNYYTKLIKPLMDSIKKEERMSVGAGGKK